MADRNSRCKGGESLIITCDGAPLQYDVQCIGIKRTYVAEAVLDGSISYEWYIDSINNPIVSTSQEYTYTFDDKAHNVIVVVKSITCSLQHSVKATGKVCTPNCPVECLKEHVSFPGGRLKFLTDNYGNIHQFTEVLNFECAPASTINDKAAKAIQTKLKNVPNCSNANISVRWEYKRNLRNCITLTITNSSMKFVKVTIDNNEYLFNTTYC